MGVGLALRARGHRVTLITNGYFGDLIQRSGLEFIELGSADEFKTLVKDPLLWDPVQGSRFVFKFGVLPHMRPLYEKVAQLYKPGQTIFVGSALAFGARIAEEKLNIPYVSLHLQPSIFQSVYETPIYPTLAMRDWWPHWWKAGFYRLINALVDRELAPEVNGFRAELGLTPVRALIKNWWHASKKVIGLFPDWYALHEGVTSYPPDWPVQTKLTSFPLYDAASIEPFPSVLKEFLAAGEPPVVFTPGSAMSHGHSFFQESLGACQQAGLRGVFVTRFAEQLPAALPKQVLHVPYVPFSQLLPQSSVLVHHGGIGTTAQALAAGIPQLITPFAHDQPDNAERVRRLGVGAILSPKAYRAAAVAHCLSVLRKNLSVTSSCSALRERLLKTDPFPEICKIIESAL
jgi:rhamnosyltransferase subunit B